jgi:hypothetical protein
VALALTLALGVAGLAYAGGTNPDADASVEGQVTKKKKPRLSPKKFKKVDFHTGVVTVADVTGTQANPASEKISFGKNIKFKNTSAPVCTTVPGPGSTPAQARAACPAKSFLGSGGAIVQFPIDPPGRVTDTVVSTFNGPGPKQIQLHTFSNELGAGVPTVLGTIVKANEGKKYGKALSVPNAPETGSFMIQQFDTEISKKSGVVRARCKSKKFFWKREATYTDGTTDTATHSQKCKKKKKK